MSLNKYNKIALYRVAVLCLVLLTVTVSVTFVHASDTRPKVYLIPVSGTVEPGMAAFVKNTLKEIKDDKET